MKPLIFSLSWILGLFLLGVSNVSLASTSSSPSNSRVFVPVMVCQDSKNPRSLALYEGETLRSLQYSFKAAPSVAFKSPEISGFFKEALAILQPFSPSRSHHYQDSVSKMLSQLNPLESGELVSGSFYSEILLPSNCRLKTLAILDWDDNQLQLSGIVDVALWNQLDRLSQASAALEIFMSEELLSQSEDKVPTPETLRLGTRALAGYILAENSPLQAMPVRFDIFHRAGFAYAESDAGLCIRLDQKIIWKGEVPVSGYAFSSDGWPRQCSFQWQGQTLYAEGYFLTSADRTNPQIRALSITFGNAGQITDFLDTKRSALYGQSLYFNSSSNDSLPLRFFADGSVEYGVLPGSIKAHLKWETADLLVGFPLSREEYGWLNAQIAFWPNGKPRRIERAKGQVRIQNQWYALESEDLYFYENGQIQCAEFPAKTKFKKKNGGPYILTENNRYTCFDEQSDPIEMAYTSALQTVLEMKIHYPFSGDPAVDRPRPE